MLRRTLHARTIDRPDHHRQFNLSAKHIMHEGGVIHQLVHRNRDEVIHHNLSDRTEARCRRTGGCTDNCALGNRGVPDPLRSELIKHSRRNAETSSEFPYIFTKQQYIRILAHSDAHCLTNRFHNAHSLHLTRTSSTISV